MRSAPSYPGASGLWSGLKIGLLGGSFNPAHPGHRHISLMAMHRLGLDWVWWLVSPQNPLKPATGMAPMAERLVSARRAARHPRIYVSDLEARLGTQYTADTLRELKRYYPRARFVWLMGADNLATFTKWQNWQSIMRAVPIAVIDRPGYALRALRGPAARRFQRYRLPQGKARRAPASRPPAWVLLRGPRHSASATEIRQRESRPGW